MKLIKFIICLLLFGLTSCSPKQSDTFINDVMLKDYPVNPKDAELIYASSIFDSIAYVCLPFTDSTVIGSIEKLEIFDSHYYFWDRIGKKIWCYDFNGDYVFQLDKRGQGPGEYIQINDFNIDRERQQIQILDRGSRKILCYDMADGRYIKDVKIDVAAWHFAVLQNGFLLYTRGVDIFMGKDEHLYGYNVFVTDSLGILQEERYFPYDEIADNLVGYNTFENHNQQILFSYSRNDTIYEFDNTGQLICKILFDFGKYKVPLKTIKTKDELSNYMNKPNYGEIQNTFQTLQYIFARYNFENRIRFLLMNKRTEKIINCRFLENDIDYISFHNPTPISAWQNQLIFVKNASEIVTQKKEGKPIHESIPQLSLLKEDDNPVIVIAYLKTQ